MGYHLIDMILWYFGLPDRVLADLSVEARPDRTYDAEDTALIHFGYESGLYGSLLLSRFIGPKTEQIRLVWQPRHRPPGARPYPAADQWRRTR
jgi:predicted dehydrogenase